MTLNNKQIVPKTIQTLRLNKDFEKLVMHYHSSKWSLSKIYKCTGYSPSTIRKLFIENNIPLRSRNEAIKLGRANKQN